MNLGFRNCDSRYPFFWERAGQPAARWNRAGEGPVQYLADSPDGAWAEFLRHEEIHDVADLAGVARSLWAVELPKLVEDAEPVSVQDPRGGVTTYADCQDYAADRRAEGVVCLVAPSAALIEGGARGQVTNGGLVEGADRDGRVWILFGTYPDVPGWRIVEGGRPPERILSLVHPLSGGLHPGTAAGQLTCARVDRAQELSAPNAPARRLILPQAAQEWGRTAPAAAALLSHFPRSPWGVTGAALG